MQIFLIAVGAHTHRVPTITDTCDPEWNLTYDFPIEVVVGQELLLEFYDDDDRKDDEFLGRAKVQTSVVAQRVLIHFINALSLSCRVYLAHYFFVWCYTS